MRGSGGQSEGRAIVARLGKTEAANRAVGDGGGSLLRQIKREYVTYGKDWSRPGFRAVVVHRFGTWAEQLPLRTFTQRTVKRVLDRLYLFMNRFVRNHYGIELNRSAHIGRDVIFAHQGGIVIHRYATIGDRCLIHQNVTIGNAGRGISEFGAPVIGDDVELGVGAVILGEVKIGDRVSIGANVVVYTDLERETTVVHGAPRIVDAPRTRQGPGAVDAEGGRPA